MRLIPPLSTPGAWPVDTPCPIEATIRVIGSRPAMILLREAAYGVTRFDDFTTRTGLSGATVATRLAELTDAGVLERQPYRAPGARSRDEYVLTEAGHELLPIIVGLFTWGMRHAGPSASLSLTHTECAADVHAEVRCASGHPVALDDLTLTQTEPTART